MMTELLVQQDDHCWLTIVGRNWKVLRAEDRRLYVWRGYEPTIEYGVVDLNELDVERYTRTASEWLVGDMGEPT